MAIDLQQEANKALQSLNSGQFNPALKTARAAIKSAPREAFFYNIAGLALSGMGKERDAIAYYQKALALNPDYLEVQKNLAQALFLMGKHDKVKSVLDRLLAKHPDDGDALYLMAVSLTQLGEFATADGFATRAIETGVNPARSLNLRGIIRQNRDNLTDAISDFEQAVNLTPDNAETLANYSFALALKGLAEDALAALQRALEIAPDHVNALQRMGGLLNQMGRKDDSIATFRRLLGVAPGHPGALSALAGLQDRAENAAMIPQLTAAFSRAPKGALDRTDLAFALWSAYKQAGDLPEAEKWLLLGNKNAAAMRPYDVSHSIAQQEKIFALFPQGAPLPENPTDSGPMPIFVLGLIRSGTTLTEQILSANSAVFGAGEMATAGFVYQSLFDDITDLTPDIAAEFARQYRANLPDMPTGATAFVDKMPGNFRLIGFLLAAFPNCKIINLVRDPRDTGLSAFSNDFPAQGLNYTYDLKSLADQFNFYRATINRWEALFPGRILHHEYASMVRDVEATSHKLAAFCELDWEPSMARPQDNTRAVMTASVNQVRAGVHTKSLAGWKKHATMLQPFIDALDPALWPELADENS